MIHSFLKFTALSKNIDTPSLGWMTEPEDMYVPKRSWRDRYKYLNFANNDIIHNPFTSLSNTTNTENGKLNLLQNVFD